jgi:hypothetical protein
MTAAARHVRHATGLHLGAKRRPRIDEKRAWETSFEQGKVSHLPPERPPYGRGRGAYTANTPYGVWVVVARAWFVCLFGRIVLLMYASPTSSFSLSAHNFVILERCTRTTLL